MMQLFDFLQQYSDYFIIGLLLLMSIIMLAMVIERYLFLRKVNVAHYSTIHALDIDLNRNMTVISTIGANAPYVGLLGTVIGILLTFYQIGHGGGEIDTGVIMMHLSLALKATALGILVAIPSMVFYNGLGRKVVVNRLKWKVLNEQKDKEYSVKKFDEINIIPFIDIMLVLLAVVLITASFISQGKIQVNVPKASTAVAFKADELAKLLTVTADKQLYFNDRPITQEALEAEIAQWNKDQKVTLKIDAEASFQDFVTITDMLSKNEIKNVAIVSMKDKGKSAGKNPQESAPAQSVPTTP